MEKKTVQSNLASHYEQMANYQKALKEREKYEESLRAERLREENFKALEAEKLKKRAKIEEYKQQQFEFLRQKEEEKQRNFNNDDFKKSASTNIFRPKYQSQVISFIHVLLNFYIFCLKNEIGWKNFIFRKTCLF